MSEAVRTESESELEREMRLARLISDHGQAVLGVPGPDWPEDRTALFAAGILDQLLLNGHPPDHPDCLLCLDLIALRMEAMLSSANRWRMSRLHKPRYVGKIKLPLPAPMDLPPSILQQLKQSGYGYHRDTGTWEAWESDGARAVYNQLKDQQSSLQLYRNKEHVEGDPT